MIGGVEWTFSADPAPGQWTALLSSPRRNLTIAWDPDDRVLYLSVVAPAAPNVPGSQPRHYASPVSMLAAMLILPQSEHARVIELVQLALTQVVDGVIMDAIQKTVDKAVLPWPEPARVPEYLRDALEGAGHLDRLALDLATAEAWVEKGAPL